MPQIIFVKFNEINTSVYFLHRPETTIKIMERKKIDACLKKHGFYPMALILKYLEKKERYEDCLSLHNTLQEHKEQEKQYCNAIPEMFMITNITPENEQEYLKCWGEKETEEKIKERLSEINQILKLNLKIQ